MNTDTQFHKLALTDFQSLYESDPTDAINRMAVVLNDDELFEIRMAMLEGIGEAARREGLTQPERSLDTAITAVGRLGVWEAIDNDEVTFDELAYLFNDPVALQQTRDAFLCPPLSVLLDTISCVNPTGDGLRCLPEHEMFFRECDVAAAVAGAGETTPIDPSESPQWFWIADGIFYLEVPIDEIPNGLCQIGVTSDPNDPTTKLATQLPVLELEGGTTWVCEISIRELFANQVPEVDKLYPFLIRATEYNRSRFDSAEVHEFVGDLPDGKQRTRARAYLRREQA